MITFFTSRNVINVIINMNRDSSMGLATRRCISILRYFISTLFASWYVVTSSFFIQHLALRLHLNTLLCAVEGRITGIELTTSACVKNGAKFIKYFY